jgi:hypothetical protein
MILTIISSWLINFMKSLVTLFLKTLITYYATSAWVTYESDFILNGNSLKLCNGALVKHLGFDFMV